MTAAVVSKFVYVSLDKYEQVRARRFILAPGHDIPDVENIVEQGQRYAVVERHQDAAPIVEATDP